ncbi:MAG: CBS domain-containing protein [Deltaproteobacteria bacterium]|nr:CBS domain-containing protein [Deltaproteobacteria bacterium]
MQIHEVMTPCPHVIDAKASLTDAVKKMKLQGIRHLPVVKDGTLLGVVTEHDVELSELVCKISNFCPAVGDLCIRDVYSVTADALVADVSFEMAENKRDCAIVVDNDDKIVGIFTTIDACRLVHLALRGKDEAFE